MRKLAALLTLLLAAPTTAGTIVSYGVATWDDYYATLGTTSIATGRDLRQGTILNAAGDDDVAIYEDDNPSQTLFDDPGVVSVHALPAGVIVVPQPGAYSAKAQTTFGANHVAVDTTSHIDFDSVSGDYYLTHANSGAALSRWSDEWTFTGSGLVTFGIGWDATFAQDPLCPGPTPCLGTLPNGTDSSSVQEIAYSYQAAFAVFDLDELVTIFPDDGDPFDVPATVISVNVRHVSSSNDESLDPIAGEESLQFTPTAGHRYVVASEILLLGAFGADVDAFNTLALESVLLSEGLDFDSLAGAAYNVQRVPEPAAAGLIAAALGALALRRFARRTRA